MSTQRKMMLLKLLDEYQTELTKKLTDDNYSLSSSYQHVIQDISDIKLLLLLDVKSQSTDKVGGIVWLNLI